MNKPVAKEYSRIGVFWTNEVHVKAGDHAEHGEQWVRDDDASGLTISEQANQFAEANDVQFLQVSPPSGQIVERAADKIRYMVGVSVIYKPNVVVIEGNDEQEKGFGQEEEIRKIVNNAIQEFLPSGGSVGPGSDSPQPHKDVGATK